MGADQIPLDVEAIRAELAAMAGRPWTAEAAEYFIGRLLDENARLNTELAARDRTIEALSARLTAKNAELDKTIQGMLNAGAEWAEKIEAMRAEREEAIREAAADKAKLAAKLAEAEAQIEAGRRVDKGEPCPECGGTVSPWRDVWGKVRFHACTTCTWPLPSPDRTPRTAPEMPRPAAEEAALEYRCPNCYRWALWTDGVVDGDDEGVEEFWCQTCGSQTPLESMDSRPQEPVSGSETAGTGSGRGTGVTEADGAHADLSLIPVDLIKSDPGIRGGEPCITGTRIPAHEVAGYLADGATWDEVRAMLPSLPSLPVPREEA